MRKTLLALFAVCSLSLSSAAVMAEDLGVDMDLLAKNYKTVMSTQDIGELKTALNAMRAAAVDAKKSTPEKLSGKDSASPEVKGYQQGLDTLVGQIDGALKLANEGKLKEAQALAANIKQTREENHKKYR